MKEEFTLTVVPSYKIGDRILFFVSHSREIHSGVITNIFMANEKVAYEGYILGKKRCYFIAYREHIIKKMKKFSNRGRKRNVESNTKSIHEEEKIESNEIY